MLLNKLIKLLISKWIKIVIITILLLIVVVIIIIINKIKSDKCNFNLINNKMNNNKKILKIYKIKNYLILIIIILIVIINNNLKIMKLI